MAAVVYLVIATVAFIGLTFAARGTLYFGFDLPLTHALQSYTAPWVIAFLRAVGWPGFAPQVYVMLAGFCVLLFFLYSRLSALALGLGALLESFSDLGVKILVGRPRPSPTLVNAIDLAFRGASSGWGLSFPAGHPASYMVIFGFLAYLGYSSKLSRFWRGFGVVVCSLIILLIGISRIYLGDHWFSDVLAGYLLGSIVLVLTIFLYRWVQTRFIKHVH
jgi:membrane-associated phospholipid phosphatase